MCDEVLVVLRGKADTLDVFSGDMTDCIPAEVPSLSKTDILDQSSRLLKLNKCPFVKHLGTYSRNKNVIFT